MNWTIFLLVVYTVLVGILTSYGGNVNKTIENLTLPSYYPPSSVFGIVWSLLFILFGVFLYYSPLEIQIIGIVYFVLVLLWTPIFVTSGSTAAGFYYLLFIELLTVLFMVLSYYMSTMWYILLPQLVWVSFATLLSYSIYALN